jgi:FixJ family two-component response regulator
VDLNVITFESANDFLAAYIPDLPACLVLDVRLPGLSGLDLQTRLTEIKVDLPIIFVTGQGDVPMAVRAMKAGAVDVLTKPFRDQELLDAIRQALDRNQLSHLEKAEKIELRKRFESLTPREREVMELVTGGRLNKQIAGQLGISEVTVKIHRGNVMKKMQAKSVAALVGMAARLAKASIAQ